MNSNVKFELNLQFSLKEKLPVVWSKWKKTLLSENIVAFLWSTLTTSSLIVQRIFIRTKFTEENYWRKKSWNEVTAVCFLARKCNQQLFKVFHAIAIAAPYSNIRWHFYCVQKARNTFSCCYSLAYSRSSYRQPLLWTIRSIVFLHS